MKGLTGPFLALAVVSLITLGVAVRSTSELKAAKAELQVKDSCLVFMATHGLKGDVHQCDAAIQSIYWTSERAGLCNDALNRNLLAETCSTEVKALFGEKVEFETRLDMTVQGQSAAIARAEARVRAQASRNIQNERALAAAPRLPDGLIVCDADCLRKRFDQGAQP